MFFRWWTILCQNEWHWQSISTIGEELKDIELHDLKCFIEWIETRLFGCLVCFYPNPLNPILCLHIAAVIIFQQWWINKYNKAHCRFSIKDYINLHIAKNEQVFFAYDDSDDDWQLAWELFSFSCIIVEITSSRHHITSILPKEVLILRRQVWWDIWMSIVFMFITSGAAFGCL